jgi:uncharacterized protein YneF (UPF0154 family)
MRARRKGYINRIELIVMKPLQQCLLCSNRRQHNSKFCKSCEIYKPYEGEVWFNDLVEMQRKQRKIDVMESYTFGMRSTEYWQTPKEPLADIYGKSVIIEYAGLKPKATKPPGRPRIAEAVILDLIQTFKDNPHWSVNKVRAALTKKGYTISRETIRKIIAALKKEMTKNSFND